jgi:LysR family hydrogen peroxide-inducible transcriptional activator
MTLTELRYIIAVAQERHFGRAAAACHVSQPTLSVAVKKLEAELGVALFERRANEVTLTPLGRQIVEQAQLVIEGADAIKLKARQGKNQLEGPVRMGAIYTIGPYLFPELIPLLHRQAPKMPLIIEENYTAVLSERLKRGELDMILVSLPFSEPGIVTLPLYEEPFVLLLPASHPLTQRKLIQSKHLVDEPVLLLGSGHCFRDQVVETCPACIGKPGRREDLARTVEGGSLETIRHMVISGLGLTVLPCTAAGADRYSQRLISIRRFAPPEPRRTVALAWRVSFPRPKVIDLIQRAVHDCHLSCVKPVRGK